VLEDIRVQNFTSQSSGIVAVFGSATGTLHLSNTFLEGNQGNVGGALYLSNLAECNLTHSTFLRNSAISGGALGIYANTLASRSLSITDCIFQGNNATGQGGAVYLFFGSPAALLSLSIVHTTLVGNIGTVGEACTWAPRYNSCLPLFSPMWL